MVEAKSEEYARFVRQRHQLNEQLSASAAEVEAWVQEHDNRDPMLDELAVLEGLLDRRRNQLRRLAELDDAFMNYLVSLRNQRSDS